MATVMLGVICLLNEEEEFLSTKESLIGDTYSEWVLRWNYIGLTNFKNKIIQISKFY